MTHVLQTCHLNSYAEAQGNPKREQAMITEMDSLLKKQTWYLVPQPQGKNILKCQFIEHHMACMVMKGFSQQEGIDYTRKIPLLQR
jgi:hypothetical protein